jgi:hypothetical protein
MAVHGTLNPELGAKARVDIYEGGGGGGGGKEVEGIQWVVVVVVVEKKGGIHTHTWPTDPP